MKSETSEPKVVVFDLDETLGYFGEFSVLYNIISSYLKVPLSHRMVLFNTLIELYPEYLRPDIINILNYLKNKKKTGECKGVYIYTNNQGPVDWCEMIKLYLHNKIQYSLFDHVVGAFRVNGRVREVGRTSDSKITEDLIRCARLPDNSDICFIDNDEFEKMTNVYYIKLNTYIYNLSMNVAVNRFLKSYWGNNLISNKQHFVNYVNRELPKFKKYVYEYKPDGAYEMDIIATKQLMEFLEIFFQNNY